MIKNNSAQTQINCLGQPEVIWCIPAVHGNLDQLITIHDQIFNKFNVGQRLVYLGNYTGYGNQSKECIDEILTFRRLLLSLPAMRCADIVFLRGQQEEILHKFLQLSFAPNPLNIYEWMLDHGMAQTLESYGVNTNDGLEATRAGSAKLAKWINSVRTRIRKNAGHERFSASFVQAARTELQKDYPLLFVNTGLNADLPLDEQNDNFWWNASSFEKLEAPYAPFQKVIRGYDPKHGGLAMNEATATLDAGCGFGGNLISAAFDQGGEIYDFLES